MTFADFFAAYWWLIFPVFGMAMAFSGMNRSERMTKEVLDLVKSYVQQGKDPPPELLRRLGETMDEDGSEQEKSSPAWTPIVFTAIAVAAAVGYFNAPSDADIKFVLMIVAVGMGVMAAGSLLLLIFRKR